MSWERATSRNGGGIIRAIGEPSGLSDSAIESILNLWQRPQREKFSRQPSKVYHRPGCPGFAAMHPANIVMFASETEAQQAGYRKANNCP
jgi:deoxyribonuclease-1